MQIKMNTIPTASPCNKLPLPSHLPYEVAKYTPPVVDRTYPKLIWCMCFTDPSETAIKYVSLSLALSTSSMVVSILFHVCLSGENWTNLMRSIIHAGWSVISCSNDYTGPNDNTLSILSFAPNSLYTVPLAVVLIQTGILCFVGWYSFIVLIHVSCVPLFVCL